MEKEEIYNNKKKFEYGNSRIDKLEAHLYSKIEFVYRKMKNNNNQSLIIFPWRSLKTKKTRFNIHIYIQYVGRHLFPLIQYKRNLIETKQQQKKTKEEILSS